MKRVNKEHITAVVDGYLQRRNFASGEINPLEFNKVPFSMLTAAVNTASMMETSSLGAVAFGSITEGNTNEAEQQFSRLVRFVKEANDKHKSSLMNILFPIFISIYVDMLVCELKQTAHRFHQTNRPIFNNLPIYRATMEAITMVVQKCDKDRTLSLSKMLHSELGEIKYNVTFTLETLNHLTKYLASRDNMMILQVFNSNITIEIATDPVLDPVCPVKSEEDTTSKNTDAISKLKSAIEEMHEVVSPQPELRLHNITSQYPGIVCGHVTNKLIALGCNDSSIRIFNKNGQHIRRQPLMSLESQSAPGARSMPKYEPDVSKPRFAGDWFDDAEDCASLSRAYEPKQYSLTMRGHSAPVYSITSFEEHDYLLSSSADKTIRLWDTAKGINRVIYQGHTQTVWSVTAAHRSSYFASCSKDRSAKLWTSECTFPLRTYVGHTMSIDTVRFHPNNNYLATASQDRTVRLWSVQEGKCVRLMQGHKCCILSLAFSPTGNMLASAGEDRRIRLWDLASGELIKELKGHTDTIHCLEFNGDGSLLCSGAQDNTIITWDTRLAPDSQSQNKLSGSPAVTNIPTDVLATYNTQDSNIVSIQTQSNGVMEVVGVT